MTSITGAYSNTRGGNFTNLFVSNDADIQNDLTVGGIVSATGFTGGTFTSTNIELANASASSPALSFLSDLTTGVYYDTTGSNGYAVSVGGTKRMKLDTSTCSVSLPINIGGNTLTAGELSISGLASLQGGIDCGTQGILAGSMGLMGSANIEGSLTCSSLSSGAFGCTTLNSGAITCTTVTASGRVEVPDQSGTAPGLIFGTDSSTGFNRESAGTVSFFSSGSEVFRMGATEVQSFQAIATGTQSLSCGGITCSSVSSSGLVSQPQYSITNNGQGSTAPLSAGLNNVIPFPFATDVLVNWASRSNLSSFPVPVAGLYYCNGQVCINSAIGNNSFKVFWTKNDATPSASTSTYYSIVGSDTPNYTFDCSYNSCPLIQCNAGDILRLWCQSTGNFTSGNATDNSRVNSVYINWLHP